MEDFKQKISKSTGAQVKVLFGDIMISTNNYFADAKTQKFIFDEKKHKTDLLYEHAINNYEKIIEIQLKNFCPICKGFPRYIPSTKIKPIDTYFLKCECGNINIKVN